MMNLSNERRSTERSRVMLSALVEKEGAPEPMKVLNLSEGGALVLGSRLTEGTSVMLRREGTDVRGYVAWVRGEECGLRFERPVNVRSVLRTIPTPRAAFNQRTRRPGLKAVPLSNAEISLLDTWVTRGATARCD